MPKKGANMKIVLFVMTFGVTFSLQAKEWKSIEQYQKFTHNAQLSSSDWLASDRRQNTLIWKHANAYNLVNDKPQEYQSIKQRRDFYSWINHEFESKGQEVTWPKMAYYISFKLRLLQRFPHRIFTSKKIKLFSQQANELIFNSAFDKLGDLFTSEKVLKNQEAIQWDKLMLHDEQYIWVDRIYKEIDSKSLKQIEHIVKGKFLYALVVPKAIRFEGDISNPEERYRYAFDVFRPYCLDHIE